MNAVLREQLKDGGTVHTVVLGSPTVDITNQFIGKGLTEENVIEVVASACNMVEAAEYALKTGQVEQVVLLQHTPRYDTQDVDPEEVRSRLVRMANNKLEQARNASEWAERTLVGEHSSLECMGRTRINMFTSDHTFSRNRSIRMGKYDGVHLYSLEGAKALTNSILAILGRAGLKKAASREGGERRGTHHTPTLAPAPQEYISPWLNPPAGRGFQRNQEREGSSRQEQEQFQLPTNNRFSDF